jgi:hypothetical protein
MRAMFALCLLCLCLPALAQEGLLAHFACDEGSGGSVKDAVSGLTGAIHGATWAKSGDGYCLRFDGVDDFVDCGDPPQLSPTEAMSLEVWVLPEKVPSTGEPGIVGKAYHNYGLTYYGDSKVWWYVGNSEVNVKAVVSPGSWHHLVGTYQEGLMKLYVDGELAGATQGKPGKIPATEHFFFATSKGDVQWTKHATFCGMIDEVRLYDRALAPEEVRTSYRTTKLTRQVDLVALPAYAARELIVQMDVRGLGEIPPGASVKLSLTPARSKRPLITRTLTGVTSYSKLSTVLSAQKVAPGPHGLTAQALDARGKPLGRANTITVVWPAAPKWQVTDPHIKVLNNLVSELRNLTNIKQDTTVQFTNPREGWVFISSTAGAPGRGTITVTVPAAGDLAQVIKQRPADQPVAEAMRRLPAGKHDLAITCAGGATVKTLVVRAIPEIGYCRVDSSPQLAPYGPADWPMLEKYVLPHINLAVSGSGVDRARLVEWKRQGKRWIIETPLPGIGKAEGPSVDEVFEQWAKNGRLDEPLLDGMIVDEFGAGDEPIWQSWHGALKRLKADPRFRGKVFYPYCGPLYGAKASREFTQTVIDSGWAAALERYLPEAHTELEARSTVYSALVPVVQEWAKAQPDIVPHLLIVWGFLISTPPESTNVDPAVDLKAFMDLQFSVLANDPTFFGLYGVTSYLSGYSEEEIIRWTARLYRHYCIEGRADRLTDYYELTHLRNPDFDQGLQDWQVQAAEAGSVTTGRMNGLSFLQGRYPYTVQGENFMLMRHSARGPNRVTQIARNLKPGQTYSLKMISADYGDLQQGVSSARVLPVRLEVQGVQIIPDRTFQHPFKSCYSHIVGPFNAKNPAGFNMHNITFRAQSPTATVVISDGAEGASVGQEIICNFLELQPYYDRE